jgi:hypothetical protein
MDSFPSVLYRLVFGSPTLLFDLVSPDFDQSSLVQRDLQTRGRLGDFIGSITNNETELNSWWADLLSTWAGVKPAGTFGLVPTIGPLAQFDWNARNSESTTPVRVSCVLAVDPCLCQQHRDPERPLPHSHARTESHWRSH